MTSIRANDAFKTAEKLDELKRYVEQISTEIDNAQEFTDTCFICITHAFAKGKALDPRNPDHTGRRDRFYQFVYQCFHDKRLAEEVTINLFIPIWHELQMIQKEENILIYGQDAVAAALSDAFSSIRDKGAAMRWRLALIASKVFCNKGLSPQADLRISQWYGLPVGAINQLQSIALSNRNIVAARNDWSIPEAFPEDSVTKFLATSQGNDVLFAHHTARDNDFPISAVYFGSLLEKMNRVTDPLGKGHILEDLATYLTLLVPGWIPRRNVMTTHNEFESDIIISDRTQAGNLSYEYSYLVECKNWTTAVGVQEVGYLLFRMILSRTKCGILFASNGITGASNKLTDQNNVRRAATSLIQRAFDHNGNICIVIDGDDLNTLKYGRSSFGAMIRKKAKDVHGKSLYAP